MNPGKIIPGPNPLQAWGLSDEVIKSFKQAD